MLSGCGKKPPLPSSGPPPDIETPVVLKGRVVSYGTNPEGNIDRIILYQGNRKPEIHFPPHLAEYILDIANVNASVNIKTSSIDRGYELVSIASEDGKKVFNAGQILPPKPRPGKEIRIAGTVSAWIRNRENTVTGFVIGKRTVLLNPEEGRILTPLLMKAKRIEVAALERDAGDGTINTLKFPPVKATEIKIDSIIYKIR
ncbi:hypothetical protein [Chryseobacterium hagamense]|uniref:Uncharacterized protein n=1 Tax=Chryseobacterium hagamense TaxID=395935 RepID=A0A511YS49_9FLAO|nr:hypothetical protein [Chryseobacterium hagamense]GEN78015.1 hypothetical protein CHA01nite_37550 [Chryseobacterium hagamense]